MDERIISLGEIGGYMDFKSEEYSALRAELLEEQSAEASLLLTMYTVFVALITFGIDKRNYLLFLLAIYVNFLFKLQLSWKHTGRMRIVAYLIVNYENKYESIHWESDLGLLKGMRNKYLNKWLKIVSFSSSKMVTLMSVFACSGMIFLIQSNLNFCFVIIFAILYIVGILLHIILDGMQLHKDIKSLFIEEFENLNSDKDT